MRRGDGGLVHSFQGRPGLPLALFQGVRRQHWKSRIFQRRARIGFKHFCIKFCGAGGREGGGGDIVSQSWVGGVEGISSGIATGKRPWEKGVSRP